MSEVETEKRIENSNSITLEDCGRFLDYYRFYDRLSRIFDTEEKERCSPDSRNYNVSPEYVQELRKNTIGNDQELEELIPKNECFDINDFRRVRSYCWEQIDIDFKKEKELYRKISGITGFYRHPKKDGGTGI
ncbi:MAG: hypothetical protein ABEJ56_00970 [Candidatus Nanohaloarchaea archaeon]